MHVFTDLLSNSSPYFELLGIIFIPLLFIMMMIFIIWNTLVKSEPSKNVNFRNFLKYFITLDDTKGVGSQPIFWFAMAYPLGLFLSTGFIAWAPYSLELSTSSFTTFISISKLSLGLLGLSIPFAVLVARLHGTKQTALQIKTTEQKNRTDLYLSHYSHFTTYIESIENEVLQVQFERFLQNESVLLFDKHKLYKSLYPFSSITTGIEQTTNKQLYENVKEKIIKLYKHIDIIVDDHCDFDDFATNLAAAWRIYIDILSTLCISRDSINYFKELNYRHSCDKYSGEFASGFTIPIELSVLPERLILILKYLTSFGDSLSNDQLESLEPHYPKYNVSKAHVTSHFTNLHSISYNPERV